MGRFLGISLLTLTIFVFFQNCQSFETQQAEELSSQCKVQMKEKVLSKGGWPKSECSQPSHYKCNLLVYKPDIENSHYKDTQCVDKDNSEYCLEIEVKTHDTSHLLENQQVDDEAFIEGGALNRMEYRCAQIGILEKGQPLIVEVSDSLEGALEKAIKTCSRGVK